MKRHSLKVKHRSIFGKKLNQLRKNGILPSNIYGKSITSEAVEVSLSAFNEVYTQAGETGLVDLELDGVKRPVLIHHVQLDYLTQKPIHADFYQVNLQEKIKTMIPIVLKGEPKAVSEKAGLLLQTLHEIEVEALPTDLPEKFEVDVTTLSLVNDQITVGDVIKIEGVVILTDASQTIAKISELVSEEAQQLADSEAAASAEAKSETVQADIPSDTTTVAQSKEPVKS